MTRINDLTQYPHVYVQRDEISEGKVGKYNEYNAVTVHFDRVTAAWPSLCLRCDGKLEVKWEDWDIHENKSMFTQLPDLLSYEDGLRLLHQWLVVDQLLVVDSRVFALMRGSRTIRGELAKTAALCQEMFGLESTAPPGMRVKVSKLGGLLHDKA